MSVVSNTTASVNTRARHVRKVSWIENGRLGGSLDKTRYGLVWQASQQTSIPDRRADMGVWLCSSQQNIKKRVAGCCY